MAKKLAFDKVLFTTIVLLVALGLMRTRDLFRQPPVEKARGLLAEGLRYAWTNPGVRLPIVMMAWIGTLSFNFPVLLVVFAEQVFEAGSSGFALLISLSALGSLVGALIAATRVEIRPRLLVGMSISYGVLTIVASTSPGLYVMAFLLIPVGLSGVGFLAGSQAATQASAKPEMQGRVMALFSVVFLGSTPIGGIVAGGMAEWWGARVALGFGGIVAILTGIWAWRSAKARRSAVSMDRPRD